MLQIKKRKDGRAKFRFMSTICFYQDTRHETNLYWIQKILGIGYISRRNDGMTELRINGYSQIERILKKLMSYIRFKKVQARALYSASKLLADMKYKVLSKKQLFLLVDLILAIQSENYVTKKKKTKEELISLLGLTP